MKDNLEFGYLTEYMPYPFYENKSQKSYNRVYGQIYLDEITYWGENDGGTIKISVSLVNEKMLDREYEALDMPNTPLFFYEFTGEATFNHPREIAKYKLLKGWEFNDYYVLKIVNIDELERNEDFILNEYKEEVAFIGEVMFSASPILSHKAILIVEDSVKNKDKKVYKKLKLTYDTWTNEIKNKCIYDRNKITAELNGLLGNNLVCRSVDIYNVGQANCCYCDLDSVKLFFDIGVTRSAKDRELPLVNNAISEIATLDVDAVVLSHWDLDHILGVCYNKKCLKKKIWIAPDFEKLYSVPRISIKRLCNYLLKNGKSKLMLVDTTEITKRLYQSSNKAISIYMGEPKAAYGINKMNNGGLILKLQNSKNILLPGDCENSIIPFEAVHTEYDNVLISHHGSVMSNPRMMGKKGKKNRAYISCGNRAGNCKLDDELEQKYKDISFGIIHKTQNLKKKNKYTIVL